MIALLVSIISIVLMPHAVTGLQTPATPVWMQLTLVRVAPANIDDYIAAQRDVTNRLRRGGGGGGGATADAGGGGGRGGGGGGAGAGAGQNFRLVSRSEFGDTYRFVIQTPAANLAAFDAAGRNTDPELALLNAKALRYVTGQESYAIRNMAEISNPMPQNQQPALMVINVVHVTPGREQDYYNLMKGEFLPHFDKANVFHTTGNVVFGGPGGFIHYYFYNNFAALDAGSPVVKALGAAGAQAVTSKFAGIVTSSEQWITRLVPELSIGPWTTGGGTRP